jgi:hypothetical protein
MEQALPKYLKSLMERATWKNLWVDVNVRPKLDSKRNWISECGLDATD